MKSQPRVLVATYNKPNKQNNKQKSQADYLFLLHSLKNRQQVQFKPLF